MRARGACLVWVAACALATACGSDTKKPSGSGGNDAEGGDDGRAGSSKGASSSGGSTGATGSDGGDDGGGKSGSGNKAGTDAGGTGGNAGQTGDAGAGGSEVDPTKEPLGFTVTVDERQHPISPLIYGANQPGLDCDDPKARFTFCRHRSAAWSTYNWETNASNAGKANCNENNAALSASSSPGAAVLDRIDEADAAGAGTVVTVPMLGYAAADKNDGTEADACSGDISKSNDYLNTRMVKSRARKGAALSLTPDVEDEWVNQDEFIAFLKSSHGSSSLLFALDNQPELWNADHSTLRSQILTYDEHIALSAAYSEMIKDNWQGAKVLGLVGYGWLAAHNLQDADDFDDKGEFLPYFLNGMSEASDAADARLLDYLDMHWFSELYPEGERVIGDGATPGIAAARVQATRSLWDPKFKEESWITQFNGGQPIQLLNWLQSSIDENFPGTEIALSEWSYGGGKHISGAIAAADALGIFGQHSVGVAGALSFSDEAPYIIGAFQAFRNYDGDAHGFGDTSVFAESSDVSRATIYASIDENDPSRMVLVAINRSTEKQPASLVISHDTTYGSLVPYCITEGHPDPVAGDAIEAESENTFALELPAYSVCVLEAAE